MLLVLLLSLLISERCDYFFSLITIDSDNPKLIFDGIFWNVLKNLSYLSDLLVIVNKHTSHESSCLLVDVNSYIFHRTIVIKNLLDILITKVPIHVLNVETGVFFELKQRLDGIALFDFAFEILSL